MKYIFIDEWENPSPEDGSDVQYVYQVESSIYKDDVSYFINFSEHLMWLDSYSSSSRLQQSTNTLFNYYLEKDKETVVSCLVKNGKIKAYKNTALAKKITELKRKTGKIY